MTRTVRLPLLAALLALAAAAPADAQAPLDFESVPTNAAGFNPTPFTALAGYRFESWGVLTSASAFGTGANAASGSRFAYAFAGAGSSYVYRTDVRFGLASAWLSFRTFDGSTAPAQVTVRAYRGLDEVFARTLTLTNDAALFTLGVRNVDEIAFETSALDGARSAVLAVDDLTLATVPEPATAGLLLGGVALLVAARRLR